MQVVQISFMRRKNLGNYEHAESSATVALQEGENSEEAIAIAQKTVAVALNGPVVAPKKEVEVEVVKEEVAKKKVAKKVAKKVTKKAPAKKAAAPKVTQQEVLAALRAYAEAKDSKEMAAQVMHDVTGAKKLNEVEDKDFAKLVKALAV